VVLIISKVFSCPYTRAPARGRWGGGGGQVSTCNPVHHFIEVFCSGLLTSCRASSWVSAAAGNVWAFWTGSGPKSLQDRHIASGGGPLGQPNLAQPCLACHPSYIPSGAACSHDQATLEQGQTD